jgi:hypothetical protein
MFASRLAPTLRALPRTQAQALRRSYADVADGKLKLSLVLPHQVSEWQRSGPADIGWKQHILENLQSGNGMREESVVGKRSELRVPPTCENVNMDGTMLGTGHGRGASTEGLPEE